MEVLFMSIGGLSTHDIEILQEKYRKREIVEGVVKTVSEMKIPIHRPDGKVETKETEVAIIRLEGGVTGYCPKESFREHEFATLNGFVGTKQEVIITHIDLENEIAMVSVLEADKIKSERFWKEINLLHEQDNLTKRKFTGVVQNVNLRTRTIHVRVEGQDCFMKENEWGWNRRNDIENEVDRGMEIEVVVKRFQELEDGNRLIEVSRRLTMDDPFETLANLKQTDLIMGRVSRVDPVHGIFVAVENVELKGSKPRSLPDPELGEFVSVRVLEVNPEERTGKVVIVDYPRGKKKRKDLTDFLYG